MVSLGAGTRLKRDTQRYNTWYRKKLTNALQSASVPEQELRLLQGKVDFRARTQVFVLFLKRGDSLFSIRLMGSLNPIGASAPPVAADMLVKQSLGSRVR